MSQWNSSRHGQKSSRSAGGGGNVPIPAAWLRIVDIGMGAIIFVGPHLLGGRHLLGRFAIVAACVVTATAWFFGQYFAEHAKWRRTSGLGILVLAIGLVAFQLAPLPSEWLATLSPRISKILPLWHANSSGVQVGEWHTISLSPEDTRLALATLMAYALLFVTAVQRMATPDDVKRIVQWIAWSAVIVAVFGIAQYFTANGKFFWIYEYPYTDTLQHLKAGFTSRNHFAHFLVLGLCCLLALTMLHRNREKNSQRNSRSSPGYSGALASRSLNGYTTRAQSMGIAVLVFAILASLSRGAVMAMLAAIAVMAVCYATAGLLRSKHILAAGILGVILVIALTLTGDYEDVTNRLETITSRSLDDLDESGGRRLVWSANLAAFRAGWLTGTGAGSHRFVYPLYIEEPIDREFTHAENGYLQVATENGLPGIMLLILALLSCAYWCYSAMRHAGDDHKLFILATGVTTALTASVVHSVVDFVWFIPACAAVTILLAACAVRLAQMAASRHIRPASRPSMGKLSKFNFALASSLAGVWALVSLFPAAVSSLQWDRYVMAEKASEDAQIERAQAGDSVTEQTVEADRLNSQSALVHLFNVLSMYPRSARANVRFAGCLISRFETLQQHSDNQMSVGQIRKAAAASHFSSPQALREWLERAFGTNSRLLYQAREHARRALALCPLQGEAYLYLAELSFLENGDHHTVEAYSDQGLLVGPQDPNILFSVGNRRFIDGELDLALEIWSRAYRGAGKHQFLINNILVRQLTAAQFINILKPGWTALPNLWLVYRENGSLDDLNALLPYAAREASRQVALLSIAQSGAVWSGLAAMQKDLGQHREALQSLQLAYAASPNNFGIRYDLASCLAHFNQFELAEQHLRWCLGQSPDNKSIRARLLQMSRAKMEAIARNSSPATDSAARH